MDIERKSSGRKRLEELRQIREERNGNISDETIVMNIVYGVAASLMVIFISLYLLYFIYSNIYFSNPSKFRVMAMAVIFSAGAWCYLRIPRIIRNYRVWKQRKEDTL